MLGRSLKFITNHNGRASKPNLAVVFLLFIIIVQTILLIRAYSPQFSKHKPVASPAIPAKVTSKPSPGLIGQTPTPMPAVGKIAIIIDDSGYSSKDCQHLSEINAPVTISILPQLPHSEETAECANTQGKGVMLHLPLEPHVFREHYPETYFIKTSMGPTAIVNRFKTAIGSVPHVSGVNNHEGSKATEDSKVMSVLFKELAKQNLFFVDSRVTSKSVCASLAEKINLPFTGRDVFLDNSSERVSIEKQFQVLANRAKLKGTAVAIGHARESSWTVMKEQIKKLQAQGYQFVTVPQIIAEQEQ